MAPPKKKKKAKKYLLIYILIGIIIFGAGVLSGPWLREKGYRIKEWIPKPPPPPREMRVVKLYFSIPSQDYLSPQERKVMASPELTEEAKIILNELVKGPAGSSLRPTLPPETKVRAVYLKGDCIYVDLSSSLAEKHPGGSTGELLTIYSIVNTLLTNFPSQSRVQILIQGEPRETLAGHIDIREPLSENRDMVKTVLK